ncbi:hypothetical protein VPFG_00160 [Vibrio phage nt-1]|uniref:Uncharacterized protein n=1 Tax=Vibrio phage nt-1 TaxID=115992 RepID=R9TJ95_9CAUD|nr:hypothetical protein VPFG_00160 [Vibrio phage nt-1]AGN30162.1 hypothetical protein VPFG_00160 [Vibrio phage nt-1]
MYRHEIEEMIEKRGFTAGEAINAYNESRWQVIENGTVIYESYNEHCIEAFLLGIDYVQDAL